MTNEQREELKQLSLPLVKWLNENMHPHAKIIIETTSIELVEGVVGFPVQDFVKG